MQISLDSFAKLTFIANTCEIDAQLLEPFCNETFCFTVSAVNYDEFVAHSSLTRLPYSFTRSLQVV